MKVLIYRGEMLHTEHDLGAQPLRIGRSAENDIVLEDPGKGVSRHHAEIRQENGGYMLVDLGSQNGIWVGGSRVPSVRLEPGVAAAVGPYRITVPAEVPAAAAPPAQEAPVEPTEYSRPAEVQAVTGLGGILDSSAETGPREAIAPPTPPAPAAERATGASTVRPASRDAASSTVRSPSSAKAPGAKSKVPAIAAAAVLVLIVAGLGAYKLLRKPAPKPVWSREAALALVNQGHCQEAMQQQIGPALAANPNDPDALALKAQCAPAPQPVPAPAPAPPPPDPTAQALDAVDASIAANDCQSALDAVNAVLANARENARALDLKTKAEECVKAAAARTHPAPAVATAIPPAQGGLDVKPGETQAEYNRRVQAMKKQYEDAVGLVQAQHYQQALKAFDAIAAGVPPGYLDLAQQRSSARDALRSESQRQYQAGQQAEQSGDFAGALQHYQRVHDLDPSHDVSADVARINDQKTRLGHEACKSGDVFYLVSRNTDAAAQYAKVLQLLPESDDCYKRAKERVALIKR